MHDISLNKSLSLLVFFGNEYMGSTERKINVTKKHTVMFILKVLDQHNFSKSQS